MREIKNRERKVKFVPFDVIIWGLENDETN
jgi:hypothetical protein